LQDSQDIVIGRLILARHLMSRELARQCLEEATRLGQPLLTVALSRALITADQAAHLWSEFQRLSAESSAVTLQGRTPFPSPASGAGWIKQANSGAKKSSGGASSSHDNAHKKPLPDPGDVIDGYEVVSLLGKGGMGAVYRVCKEGKEYALKVIITENETALARFEREAVAAATVDRHPNVVRVYSYASFAGRPYILSDFVRGCGLDEYLVKGQSFDWERALEIMIKVANAIDFIHSKGILHRDLKPANILIRGEDDEPLITDFGLARLTDYDTLTKSHDFLGTPSYMAPEQAGSDHKELGPRSDIWALGVILYELCTGQLPFSGDSAIELITRIIMSDPEAPRVLNSELPGDVETIILKALQKEKSDRYERAGAFASDCSKVLNGEPIEAERLNRVLFFSRRLKRRFGALAVYASLVFFGGLLLGLPWTLWMWREGRHRQQLQSQQGEHLGGLLRRWRAFQKRDLVRLLGSDLAGQDLALGSQEAWQGWRSLQRDFLPLEQSSGDRPSALNRKILQELRSSIAFVKAALSTQSDSLKVEGVNFSGRQRLYLVTREQFRLGNDRHASRGFEKLSEGQDRFVQLGYFGAGLIALRAKDWREASGAFLEVQADENLSLLGNDLYRQTLEPLVLEALLTRGASLKIFYELAKVFSHGPGSGSWSLLNQRLNRRFHALSKRQGWSLKKQLLVWQRIKKLTLKQRQLRAPEPHKAMRLALADEARAENKHAVALDHYLAIHRLDKSFQFPVGFRPYELTAKVFNLMSFGTRSERSARDAFQFLLRASRARIYIPVHKMSTLVEFYKHGFFSQALELRPGDPYLLFWRGLIPPQYFKDIRGDERQHLLRDFGRLEGDLNAALKSPALPNYFKAVALVARVSLQGTRSTGGDEKGRWQADLKQALEWQHPKPEDLYHKLWVMEAAGLVKLQLARKKIEALKDRRRRTREGQLALGRPWECPMQPLDRGEFERLAMFAYVQLLETCFELKRYQEAVLAGRRALDSQPASALALERYGRALLRVRKYDLFEQVFIDYRQKYGFNDVVKLQWSNYQKMRLAGGRK
jgi:serine/threonine protein kinase